MHYSYKTQTVCAKVIEFDIQDNKIYNIQFTGGCDGNLKAITRLLEGQTTDYVIEKLSGLTCGNKTTSCTDQLTKAIQHVTKEIPA